MRRNFERLGLAVNPNSALRLKETEKKEGEEGEEAMPAVEKPKGVVIAGERPASRSSSSSSSCQAPSSCTLYTTNAAK